jgi:hypothetical protein
MLSHLTARFVAYRLGFVMATRAFVKDETIPAIFEAALGSGRLFARVDILERGKRGAWNICEVRASLASVFDRRNPTTIRG